jgi:hypothetical protein
MDKKVLYQVFNSKSACQHFIHLHPYEAKLPNFKWKTCPQQILGYLSLDITHPVENF